MFSCSAINSDLMRTLFNLPVHIALHVENNIHGFEGEAQFEHSSFDLV